MKGNIEDQTPTIRKDRKLHCQLNYTTLIHGKDNLFVYKPPNPLHMLPWMESRLENEVGWVYMLKYFD